MLMAVALSHLEDPENATAAYEQAISLDSRDPAVALNFAVFLAGQGNAVGAAHQIKNFEQRVTKLRQSNLDADPQVLPTNFDSGQILSDLSCFIKIGPEYSSPVVRDHRLHSWDFY